MAKRTASEIKEESKIKDDIEFSDSDEEIEEEPEKDEDEDEEQEDIINVDFDFFDLNPDIDYHGMRTFLKQLFGDDFSKFDISGLANLILDPKATCLGSAIKTDGKDGDPLALLALLSLKNCKQKKPIWTLIEYLLKKVQTDAEFYILLKKVLGLNGDGESVGLIINERIINVPVEVSPPLFKFLVQGIEEHEPDLKYFIIISKVYKLVESEISDDSEYSDESDDGSHKNKNKRVKKNSKDQQEFEYFHYEDMILEKLAMKHGVFKYDLKLQESDSRRVFTDYGIDPQLSIILIERSKLAEAVPMLEEAFPPY